MFATKALAKLLTCRLQTATQTALQPTQVSESKAFPHLPYFCICSFFVPSVTSVVCAVTKKAKIIIMNLAEQRENQPLNG